MTTVSAVEGGRSARKRQAIMDAATELFLRKGYLGTSMDEVAARAAVSKQTVYKNFTDKHGLFNEIIVGVTGSVDDFADHVTQTLASTRNLTADLTAIAREYLRLVLRPEVLALRRLIVGEASRFPELAATYYERAPQRFLSTLTACIRDLAARDLLHATDPARAAEHLAFLVIGMPLDRAMFDPTPSHRRTDADLNATADAGVHAFLAAYAPRP